MKKTVLFYWCASFLLFGMLTTTAQEDTTKKAAVEAIEEEQSPMMYKFEPNFLEKNEERKTEIARTRQMIDTLNISDRKRLKLLKDLYKNGLSKRLQKALYVQTNFTEEK